MSLSGTANVTGTVAHRIELSGEVEALAYAALATWAALQLLNFFAKRS